jgi:ISXO2-like transposase domain
MKLGYNSFWLKVGRAPDPCKTITNKASLVSMLRRRELFEQTRDTHACIDWLMARGLIARKQACSKCGDDMLLTTKASHCDDHVWICKRTSCRRKQQSIRACSFFAQSKLSLQQQVDAIYDWARNAKTSETAEQIGSTKHAVAVIFRTCRLAVCKALESDEATQIGGHGRIIEIDETLVSKRKYNVGRRKKQMWLFGGIERKIEGVGQDCFLVIVPNRKVETLNALIQKHVAVGSTIYSDKWHYGDLNSMGYNHKSVNHSQNFLCPSDHSIHTQNIEGTWSVLKRFLRTKGTNRGRRIQEYIQEFLYKRLAFNIFDSILDDLVVLLRTGN